MTKKEFVEYEKIAEYLLYLFKEEFGLIKVEGKQAIKGQGTTWEIDGKGILEEDHGIIVVECKRFKDKKVCQGVIGTLVCSLEDVGAKGGIIVTTNGLQKGANDLAQHKNIIPVLITPDSTPNDFDIQFFGKSKGARSGAHPLLL